MTHFEFPDRPVKIDISRDRALMEFEKLGEVLLVKGDDRRHAIDKALTDYYANKRKKNGNSDFFKKDDKYQKTDDSYLASHFNTVTMREIQQSIQYQVDVPEDMDLTPFKTTFTVQTETWQTGGPKLDVEAFKLPNTDQLELDFCAAGFNLYRTEKFAKQEGKGLSEDMGAPKPGSGGCNIL